MLTFNLLQVALVGLLEFRAGRLYAQRFPGLHLFQVELFLGEEGTPLVPDMAHIVLHPLSDQDLNIFGFV